MTLKKNQRYVIFDGPEQRKGPGTRYIAEDGTSTDLRSHAAKFFTPTDARTFAERKSIILAELVHIGIEDFTDFDLSR